MQKTTVDSNNQESAMFKAFADFCLDRDFSLLFSRLNSYKKKRFHIRQDKKANSNDIYHFKVCNSDMCISFSDSKISNSSLVKDLYEGAMNKMHDKC